MFVPLDAGGLAEWVHRGALTAGPGYAATPAFLAAFGLGAPDEEETDLTLLSIASLDGLLRHGVRLVAVAETSAKAAESAEPAEFGAVRASSLPWRAVTALFADDAEGRSRAATVRSALGGVGLSEAWEMPAVEALLAATDLLWHGSTEWERLTH